MLSSEFIASLCNKSWHSEREREREREINIVQEQWVLKGSDTKD